ncbi:hypothetical protein [Paenibacillus crassostreae]|uniref:Uncharacterized protein n=1 Tax=Paenibacillus crassostreae TaxID=1763538 RepID=A0A167GKT5_9BACL|nr:hypothetical protein [Paenibacillus crassostreae]AOZ92203.1 hypothetical protein LPB68_08155 [Paenibacillus crassostreae]OAB77665.1 hypothetical protein PNBC_01235 [Paenibacillus crassostreae]
MKNLLIYLLLCILAIIIVVIMDLLTGMSLSLSFQSISAVFSVTNIPLLIFMISILILPFIIVITTSLKKRIHQHK